MTEYIGHITTPIDPTDRDRIRDILTKHGVIFFKCKSLDSWWTLILPPDSTSQKDRDSDMDTVFLPDGYSFKYLPPVWRSVARRNANAYERTPEIDVSTK